MSDVEVIRVSAKELDLPQTIPLPKRKDWGIGIIGFGEFARRVHAPDYQMAGWPIVAVMTSNPTAQKIAREQFGVERIYLNYQDLINDDRVEVVDVLTRPTFRVEPVLVAVEAGKPVITEKPFGLTLEECHTMVKAAEERRIPLAVHQNYRWMKGNYLARCIIERGWIGSPFYIGIEIFGQQDVRLANHPFYSKCDNFLTLHWNTHFVDLLQYWTGHDAVRVSAHTARMVRQNFASDNLFVSVSEFSSGTTGHILHTELLRSSLGGNRCRIDGDQGSLIFDFAGKSIALESKILGPGVRMLDTSSLDYLESICGSMGDFLIALEEGREPTVSGRRNLTTIQTVMAEIESVNSGGKWVTVNT